MTSSSAFISVIRAMIAAANADGVLDDTERMRILAQLEGTGLSDEEKDFLSAEFGAPRSLEEIAAAVDGQAAAAQVFTVSLMAVTSRVMRVTRSPVWTARLPFRFASGCGPSRR